MDPEEGEKGDGRGGGREERGREGRTGARPRGGSREVTRVTSHPVARQPISCYYYALKHF